MCGIALSHVTRLLGCQAVWPCLLPVSFRPCGLIVHLASLVCTSEPLGQMPLWPGAAQGGEGGAVLCTSGAAINAIPVMRHACTAAGLQQ